jgi:hypothetical protein
MAKISGVELVVYPANDVTVTGCVLKALQATGETGLTSVQSQMHQTP